MKRNFKFHIIGLCVTAVLLLAVCGFLFTLISANLLPTGLMITVSAVLLAVTAAIFFLVIDSRKRIHLTVGCFWAAIIVIFLGLGWYYIYYGAEALQQISTPEAEYGYIGVYVEKDDPAQTISDAADYSFGILESLDRDATDKAIKKINKNLKKDILVKEYSGVVELVEALLSGEEINAIILSESFLELLGETEGYEKYPEKLRELYSVEVKVSSATPEIPPKTDFDTFTVYISGIDTHGSISRRSRSDVNIIATVNKKTGQVLLVSTPRDYYVPLSISNGVPDKLTHAGYYGTQVSRDTLSMLYDIEIDYCFKVNFDGFKEIIDALGGITVNSEVAFKSGKYSFAKGSNSLDGDAALAFSRERYTLAGGDRQRGKNQMAVISGVIKKATGPALIKNYKSVLDGVTGSFETDMPYENITELIQSQLKNGTKWNVVSYSVDGKGDSQRVYTSGSYAYVMHPDQATVDHAKELMEQVRDGDIPTP